jgi:hypothetical protein
MSWAAIIIAAVASDAALQSIVRKGTLRDRATPLVSGMDLVVVLLMFSSAPQTTQNCKRRRGDDNLFHAFPFLFSVNAQNSDAAIPHKPFAHASAGAKGQCNGVDQV